MFLRFELLFISLLLGGSLNYIHADTALCDSFAIALKRSLLAHGSDMSVSVANCEATNRSGRVKLYLSSSGSFAEIGRSMVFLYMDNVPSNRNPQVRIGGWPESSNSLPNSIKNDLQNIQVGDLGVFKASSIRFHGVGKRFANFETDSPCGLPYDDNRGCSSGESLNQGEAYLRVNPWGYHPYYRPETYDVRIVVDIEMSQACLTDAEIEARTNLAIHGSSNLCAVGELERISREISRLNENACIKPRPKPFLPRGLDKVNLEPRSTYSSWPHCNEMIYKAMLYAGYPIAGTPSKSELDYLKRNKWQCHRVKNAIHPYRFGRFSEKEEVIIFLPEKEGEGEKLLGVLQAIDVIPERYPETLRKVKYFKSPVTLFEDLKRGAEVPKIPGVVKKGKMNQERYTKILQAIKTRGEVAFNAFGLQIQNRNLVSTESIIKLGEDFKVAYACLPPKEKEVEDNDECDDYSLDKKCIDKLCKSYGLRKGMRSGSKDSITMRIEPRFRKKAVAAVIKAGFGLDNEGKAINGINTREDQIIMHAILAEESKYNPWIRNSKSPDNSHGLSQHNLLGMEHRRTAVENAYKKPYEEVIYYPKENLEIAKWLYNGKLKLHRKNPRKNPIKIRFNDWTVWRNKAYLKHLPQARIDHREYLEWLRENNG